MSPREVDSSVIVEQALRDGDLYKLLLDQLEEGIYIVDCERRILYWNGGAERITGYCAYEVVGRLCHGDLLMHCDASGAVMCGNGCPLKAVMEDGFARECTVHLRHRFGHRIPVHIRSRAICGSDGEPVGAVEMFVEAQPPPPADYNDLAAYDCLDLSTGTFQRRYGEMKAHHALEALERFGIPFGWLRIALEKVEDYEHRYGHGMIDAALKMVAGTIAGNLKPLDRLSVWSRGEFRIECHGYSLAELEDLIRTLEAMVLASTLEWWGDPVRLTVSATGRMAERGDRLESLEAWLARESTGGPGPESD